MMISKWLLVSTFDVPKSLAGTQKKNGMDQGISIELLFYPHKIHCKAIAASTGSDFFSVSSIDWIQPRLEWSHVPWLNNKITLMYIPFQTLQHKDLSRCSRVSSAQSSRRSSPSFGGSSAMKMTAMMTIPHVGRTTSGITFLQQCRQANLNIQHWHNILFSKMKITVYNNACPSKKNICLGPTSCLTTSSASVFHDLCRVVLDLAMFFFARVQIILFFLSLARTRYEKSSVWIVLDLARYCREIWEHLTHAFFETPCTKWHITMKPLAANSWREFLRQNSPICYQKHFTLCNLVSHNVDKQTLNRDGYHHSCFFLFFIGYFPQPFETCPVCVPSWHYAFLEISHQKRDLLQLSPQIPWQICHTAICTNHCPLCPSPHTNISETNVKKTPSIRLPIPTKYF